MNGFVLDTSVTLAWCLVDERTPELELLLERAAEEPIRVPQLWSLEVGNVLLQAVRRGRLSASEMAGWIERLARLKVRTDERTAARGLHEILDLASAEGLLTYDAAYLELSMRLGVPLATLDRQLRDAAVRNGVQVLPKRL